MTGKDLTVEDIKEMVLRDGCASTLEMLMEGSPPVVHLALAAQLHVHARELRACAKALRHVSDEPEHKELAAAMLTAYKAAVVAFDAAALAVHQLYYLARHCTCEDCVNERRREAAPNN